MFPSKKHVCCTRVGHDGKFVKNTEGWWLEIARLGPRSSGSFCRRSTVDRTRVEADSSSTRRREIVQKFEREIDGGDKPHTWMHVVACHDNSGIPTQDRLGGSGNALS